MREDEKLERKNMLDHLYTSESRVQGLPDLVPRNDISI